MFCALEICGYVYKSLCSQFLDATQTEHRLSITALIIGLAFEIEKSITEPKKSNRSKKKSYQTEPIKIGYRNSVTKYFRYNNYFYSVTVRLYQTDKYTEIMILFFTVLSL